MEWKRHKQPKWLPKLKVNWPNYDHKDEKATGSVLQLKSQEWRKYTNQLQDVYKAQYSTLMKKYLKAEPHVNPPNQYWVKLFLTKVPSSFKGFHKFQYGY